MFQSSLFSLGPKFRKKGRKLFVRTHPLARWLSLGLFNRTVIIDPDKKTISITDKTLWFSKEKDTIPFDLITAVSFEYSGGVNRELSPFTHDGIESYSVGLKLYGYADPDLHLFDFTGESRFSNNGPLPNWVYWYEDLTDICGTHEEEAKQFVTVLGWVLNKPIVPK